jgi:hypothetical protein
MCQFDFFVYSAREKYGDTNPKKRKLRSSCRRALQLNFRSNIYTVSVRRGRAGKIVLAQKWYEFPQREKVREITKMLPTGKTFEMVNTTETCVFESIDEAEKAMKHFTTLQTDH